MAKLYLKIKQNGKWTFRSCEDPWEEGFSRSLCECLSCKEEEE